MKNSNIPLAIILKRTQNGYTFQALQERLSNKDSSKKPKPGRKPAIKGIPNRLIKEIGLSNDQLAPQITPLPEPQQLLHFEEQVHENPLPYQQITEQEQVSCEIDRQTQLPKTPANWFDKTRIYNMEKKEMKEFFSGPDNTKAELYMKYRNFMVQAYDRNPKRYLSKIACRRILRGDVNTIMRIHAFLEKHGVINFSLDYDGNYSFKTNSLSKPNEQSTKPQTVIKSLPQEDQEKEEKEIDTDNMTLTVINKNFSRTYRACCSECKLICGIVWFANISEEELATQRNLCFECWSKKNESQKAEYFKVDIVKKMQAHSRDGKNFQKNAWNIEQNIRLLDFMSSQNQEKNWRKLLNEFGGKRTIQDIVLQFLQFPISNIEIKQSKNSLKKHLSKDNEVQLGFNHQDYVISALSQKNILNQFYQQSEYSKKSVKNHQRNQEPTKLTQSNEFKQEIQSNTSLLKDTFALTIQKITSKVQNLKAQEQLIQSQTTAYESLTSFRKINADFSSEEQELVKSTNDLENKSRSVKNLAEKKNQSSQLLDEIEGEQNGVEEI